METQCLSEAPPLARAHEGGQARADVGRVSLWTAPPLRPERRPGASGSAFSRPRHADEGSPVTARGHWPVALFTYVCQLICREQTDMLKLSLSHNYGKPMTRTSQLTVLCREAMRRLNSQPRRNLQVPEKNKQMLTSPSLPAVRTLSSSTGIRAEASGSTSWTEAFSVHCGTCSPSCLPFSGYTGKSEVLKLRFPGLMGFPRLLCESMAGKM